MLLYEFAKIYGENKGSRPISALEASSVGKPEDIFRIKERRYTRSLLNYYIHAYCCQYVNFDSINSIMEIGSGAGKQIEVIKKLHPHLSFYAFDIPPQLYVCEQYLSALFPEDVVSYATTRSMKFIPKEQGKIFIFGSWQVPKIENLSHDLFWNSASFQEMEPARSIE